RTIDVGAVAEAGGGQRRHAAELPAAQDADGRAGLEALSLVSGHFAVCRSVVDGCPDGDSGTAAVWAARQPSSASATRASPSASTEAASSAALIAPALPIASVPTGTPPGICTIESRLSSPLSAALSTGTPKTGSVVSAATIPGRWAAPPAPAMM